MPRQLFPQNVIAVIWDFDKTLIPGNMQGPLFRHFDIDEAEFWAEVDGLEEFYRSHGSTLIQRDHLYLNHILTYVREGKMPGLGNALLRNSARRSTSTLGCPTSSNWSAKPSSRGPDSPSTKSGSSTT